MMRVITLAEKRVLIDSSLRFGIWKLLKQRLKEEFAMCVFPYVGGKGGQFFTTETRIFVSGAFLRV